MRLFPGLFLVTIGGVLLVLFAKGYLFISENLSTIMIWFFAQITLGQTFNPSIFRDFGIGVINGSLWTITVEIIFYLIVPVIVFLEKKIKFIVWYLIFTSLVMYYFGEHVFSMIVYQNKSIYDFLQLTPIVWGWMFGIGILAAKHYSTLKDFIPNFYLVIIPLCILIIVDFPGVFNNSGNNLGLVYFLLYTGVILWLAFGIKAIPLSFDVSYGIYIWHAPIINLSLVTGLDNPLLWFLVVFMISIFSWFFVEKPALRLKPASIKPLTGC